MKAVVIELSPQVEEFLRTLAPDPHKRLRTALRNLAGGKGDVLELEHPLNGFNRLRTGRYRVIFHYVTKDNKRIIRFDYAERRELVYELFSDLIKGE